MRPQNAPRRTLALTADHVARVTREVPEQDPSHENEPLTDAEREALARKLLAEIDGQPFWIFAYGSLIWKPAFEYVEARQCVAHGWHRSFCLNLLGWRASPEQPGLMLALERGGACAGVAYRMPGDDAHGRMVRLLEREIGYHRHIPWIRWLSVRANGERFRALTFYCAPPEDDAVVQLPLDQQALRLARACGPVGSCAEYLHNTVTHLEDLGIRDTYLWRLQAMVAAEIDAMSCGEAG